MFLVKARNILFAFLIFSILGLCLFLLYQNYWQDNKGFLQATGTIEASTLEVKARVGGTITSFDAQEGDLLKAGQLLIELSRHDLLAQKERDALGVLAAEARLDDLVSGARSQEINEALARVNTAKSVCEQAQRDLERIQELFDQGALAEEKLEQGQLNYELKQNELTAAEAKLSLLEAGNRPGTIAGATAELERSKAVLKSSEALLEDLRLLAPIDGTLISKNFEEGEFVTMGATLATLADLQKLWIRVYIPTDELPRIKLGQKVSISVSGSTQLFPGTVSEISSQGEFTPKSIQTKKERANVVFPVKIVVQKNPDDILKAGMPADVIWREMNP